MGGMVPIEFELAALNEEEAPQLVSTNMHYYAYGEGAPVILLHGAVQSLYTFRNNAQALSKKYRVILPDLPGHGYSDCPELDYTVEEFSLCIEAFMNALQIERAALVGFGQSAAYAVDFAAYAPDRVEKLVFIHPGAFFRTQLPSVKRLVGAVGAGAARKLAKGSLAARWLDAAYFDKTMITREMIQEYALPLQNPDVQRCIRDAIASFDDEQTLAQLARLNTPVLIVHAPDDTVSNKQDTQMYLHAARHVYTFEPRNCGYLVHEEKAERFNQAVLDFLK